MNLRQLQVFKEVIDEGTVTRAAAKLFITQPSVTIQVRRLEQACGLKLVQRVEGKYIPTTAGARLYAAAARILDLSDEIRSMVAEMRTGKSGAVRVGAATGALYYITSTLQSLRDDYSDLDINLKVATSEDISHAAAENQIDLAILWLPEASAGLSTYRLIRAPYAMIVSPRHALARCGTVPPERLDGAKFIVAVKGSGSHALFMEEVLRRLRVKATIEMEFNHTEAIKRAVEANLGIGVVPVKSVENELKQRKLVALKVSGMRLSRELALAYHPWKLEEPSVKLVSDALIRRLRPPARLSGERYAA